MPTLHQPEPEPTKLITMATISKAEIERLRRVESAAIAFLATLRRITLNDGRSEVVWPMFGTPDRLEKLELLDLSLQQEEEG
jgi:hypothetical protein